MDSICDLMFLCEGKLNFLLTSLKKEILDKRIIRVEHCDFDIKELSNLWVIPKLFVVEAELLNKKASERTYLYDLCIENNLRMVIIGESEELDYALSGISPRIIAHSFKRPVNNQEAADKIDMTLKMMRFEERKKRILVVDDSPVFLRTVSEWLENDYAVSICPSATAAFHMIEVKRPDLILLDYEMPICSGGQFLEMLRSDMNFADIPVMFLTSKSDKETVEKVAALKPQGYLLKNLPKDQIINSISEFFIMEKGK